jgi:signal transduction histidine kinase
MLQKYISKILSRISLHAVFLVPFLLTAFLAVALVGYISYQNGQKAVNEVSHQLKKEINTRIEEHLKYFLHIPHDINRGNAAAMEREALNPNNQEPLGQYFWEQIQMFDSVTSIYFGNLAGGLANAGREGADGQYYIILTEDFKSGPFHKYATDANGNIIELLSTVPNFDARVRPWYQNAATLGTATWSDAYILFTGQDMAVTASQPVYDSEQSLMGVVAVDLFLSHLGNFLTGLDVGQTGQSFILERSGLLIASSTGEEPFTVTNNNNGPSRVSAIDSNNPLTRITTEALLTEYGNLEGIIAADQFDFLKNKERYLGQISPFEDDYGLNWLIVTVIPENDFMAQINANNRATILLILLTLIVVTALSVIITRKLVKPIAELSSSASALSRGEWDHVDDSRSRIVEINNLSLSFNNMADRLKSMFNDLNREINERISAEAALIELNKTLDAKVKERTSDLETINRELDSFTYSVSHDLRAPLRRIDGFSQALLEEYEDEFDGQAREYFKRIIFSTATMNELIEDLLKLSRVTRQEIEHETVELSALVRVYLNQLKDNEPERVVQTVIAPDLVTEGDTALLRIAIGNILDNAWKYTTDTENAKIEFGATSENGRRVFYIRDNGAGFEMKHAGKLFVPFQRLHSELEYSGTGIGLSIVSRVILRHGGEVWAEGEVGKGATIFFTLP